MSPYPQTGPPRPELAELAWIAAELQRLEETRRRLVARRAVLLVELARPQPPHAPARPPGQAPASATGATLRRRPEMSRHTVAHLLLAAGGLLVSIAAVVFTAANWASIGPAGRAGILLAVSVLALAVPWPLARRGLPATAEAVAAVGLVLTAADADLVGGLINFPGPGLLAASGACAALAVVWAGYGTLAPVRVPRLAAIGAAQFPAPLAAAALAERPGVAVALALAVTAAGDLILAAWAGHHQFRAERLAAGAAAATTWCAAIVVAAGNVAVAETAARPGLPQLWLLAGVFVLAGAIGVTGVPATGAGEALAGPVAGVSGALFAVGLALPGSAVLPGQWRVAVFATAGAAIAALWIRWPLPALPPGERVQADGVLAEARAALGRTLKRQPRYLAWGGTAVLGAAAVAVLPGAVAGLLYPLSRVGQVWSGTPLSVRAGRAPGLVWHGSPATPAVLALASLACWLAPHRLVPLARRPTARAFALALAGLAAGSLPVATGMPGWAALVTLTAAAAGLVGAGSRTADQAAAWAACVAGLVVAGSAALWSLAGPAATIAELAILLTGLAAASLTARTAPAEVLATAGALAALTGLADAAVLASGLAGRDAAYAVLGVAVATAGLAAWLRQLRPRQALVLEAGTGPVVVLAVAMAVRLGDPGPVAIVLAVAGALCLGMALRPGRAALLWIGLALEEAALCVWLAAGGVHAPEPYTAPAAVMVIAAGWQRSRRPPQASSWLCYGPGVALLLLPSLVEVWLEHGWIRPLVLGVAAVLVMLAGARARLAAPLLVGAGVAVLDAGHELAPAVSRLAAMVPHWVPIAMAGLVLLFVGATYEARLRDLRRLRAALARLR
jgi:Predicted membrane protein (DUF2157)